MSSTKIRYDFVTNSSSSSFVIGKKDDVSVTIESVYQIVRGFYKDFLVARDAAIEHIAEHSELKMQYVKKDGYETFECTEKVNEKRWKLHDQFEEQCGISVWCVFDESYGWLNCETYSEYEKYWLDKMSATTDWKVHAPFTIGDFLEEREINWLHFGHNTEWCASTHKVDSTSGIVNWYFNNIEEAYKYPETCDGCRDAKYREYCQEECAKAKQIIKDENIPEDKACLYLLGRVCIHSESGYIPDYVVEKLHDISEYSCNHMG